MGIRVNAAIVVVVVSVGIGRGCVSTLCANNPPIITADIRAMCNCRKNKDAVVVTPVPAPGPRLRRGNVPVPISVPVQRREVVYQHRRNRRKGPPLISQSVSLQPLEVLDTAVWGPSMWRILHTAAEQPSKRALLATAIHALDGALPCPDCRRHYHVWLQTHPLSGTTDLRTWLLTLHNDVNARAGKTTWTVDDLTAAYGSGNVAGALGPLRSQIGVNGWRALQALV